MLHHVSDSLEFNTLKPYSISHQSFVQLLDCLEKHKTSTIGFKDLIHKRKSSIFKKEVILTFDDCPKHLWDFAIPELIKRKMKAVFYMPTAHLGSTNSWDLKDRRHQVQLMDKDDLIHLHQLGMEIGSHAHEHVKLSEIESDEFISLAVIKSKKILESFIPENIISFAYPFGSVPLNYKNLLATAGFYFATAIYHPKGDVYALRRTIYHDGDSLKSIKFKISIWYKIYRFITDFFRRVD